MGDPYRAAVAYDRIVAREPLSVTGRQKLARMKWAMGQLDAAELEYRKFVGRPDVPATAWVELAQLLIARNRRSEAPNWHQVMEVLALANKAKQRPAPAMLALLSAEALVAVKDYDKARRVLLDIKDDKEARPAEVWVGLAGLEIEQGKTDAAQAILDDALNQLGDKVELRLARARLRAKRGGPWPKKAPAQTRRGPGEIRRTY